jgi:hypothetical protein
MQSDAFSRFGESGVPRGRSRAVNEMQTSPEQRIHRLVEPLAETLDPWRLGLLKRLGAQFNQHAAGARRGQLQTC